MNAPNSLFLNKGRRTAVRRPPTSEARDAGADLDGWEFEEVGQATGAAISSSTFATWMFDADQDGDLDIFAAGYGGDDDSLETVARTFLGGAESRPQNHEVLLRNAGDGTFLDVTTAVGLGFTPMTMGANYGDLDNE